MAWIGLKHVSVKVKKMLKQNPYTFFPIKSILMTKKT